MYVYIHMSKSQLIKHTNFNIFIKTNKKNFNINNFKTRRASTMTMWYVLLSMFVMLVCVCYIFTIHHMVYKLQKKYHYIKNSILIWAIVLYYIFKNVYTSRVVSILRSPRMPSSKVDSLSTTV